MIYTEDAQWNCTTMNKHSGTVMLDFTVLDELQQEFEALQRITKQPAADIRRSFEEIVLNNEFKYLDTRIKTVVLRYGSYSQHVKPRPTQQFENAMNQHQLIGHLKLGAIQIGVNVPLGQLAAFPNEAIKPFLKTIKILAVNLTTKNLESDLTLIREFVGKNLKFPRQLLHLHVELDQVEDLGLLNGELIRMGFPIEYITISTNLLNLLLSKTLKGSNEKVVYHYQRYYAKYLGSDFYNVLDYIGAKFVIEGFGQPIQEEPVSNTPMLDSILYTIKEMEYQYKKRRAYPGGARVPSCLLVDPIRGYRGNEEKYYWVHQELEHRALEPLKRVYDGDFKGLLHKKD